MGLRLFVPLFVLVLAPAVARAVPTVDNNTGTFFDDYSDGTGLITTAPATVSTVRDPLAGAMTLSGTWTPPPACCADTSCTGGEDCVPPPALTGHFSTVDIIPSSFNAWTSIAIEHRELVTGQVEVFFDAITPTGTIVPFGPLTRIPATPAESPFTLRFSLDGVDAALYPKGRVRVAMTAATAIKPTISALRVQWRAIPRVKVVLEAPSTVCSNATLTLRNQVSVSYTDATHFLVTMARPDGALPNPPHPEVQPGPFAQSDVTAFANATEGGLFHPGPGNLVLGPNAVVPPGHVYWYRPTQPAGTSFILSASFAVPQGLLNQTTFSVQSHASAGNLTAPGGAAIAVPSNTAQITVGPTAPSPFVSRSLGNIYRIDGVDYSYPDRDISVSLSGYNYNHPQYACGETYYQAWVWDDLAPIMNKIQKPGGTLASGVFDISHSGQVSGPGGATTWDGFTIPPNVVYWDLRDLTVGEWFSLGYKVRLDKYVADGGTLVRDEVLTQCSTLRSDFRSNQSSGCRSLTIGVPDSPRGVFALGDRIRTSLSVNASFQDNNTSALQYGERYSLAMYAVNRGASALNNVVMFNKLPAQVTLDSVYVPPSANAVVRYYIGTNFNDPATPPPLDADGNPPAADAALWLATPPANKKSVTWIYVQVPALSSTFFPNLVTAPNSVTAEVYVTVDQPSGACSEFLIHDLMVGRVYGYISPDMVVASPILGGQPRILPAGVTYTPGSTTDPEWAEVRPRTPRANLALSVSPTNLVGSGTLNVNATLWNAQPGGSATGPMLDPKVVITVPSLAVNGGPAAPLAFGGVMNAPGASVDYSQLQTTGQLTFTYPTLDAFASRSISFNLVVPKGFVSGTTLAASGVATGRDASCGPTNASTGASAVIRGEPSLYLTKTVDFGVAGPGSALKYELSIANLGQAVATGAWVVDRLPDAVTLSSIKRPSWATSVWFSNAPSLPELISNDFTFNGPLIQANFVEGTYGAPDAQGNRTVSWPAGMTPRWIAWNVSDPTLSPSLLVTDTVRRLSFDVTVNPGVPENTVANNDVLAFADGLLQTIGLRAVTIISPDPSLRLAVQCGPDVLAGGEEGTLVLPYYNDSANEDESVTIEVDLAGHDYLGYTHTWNAVSQQLRGTPPITVTALGDGSYLFTIITTNDPPLDSLEGGTLEVRYAPPLASTSGDILPVTVLGLATNTDGDFSAFGRCQTLVSNPDIQVRKQIDQADPPSGQRVTFTLFLKNAGAHWAPSVVLTDVIPADFVYVANSAAILSPGWTGAPSFANDTLTWSTLRKTGVTPPAGVPQNGFLPGNTEVILTFKADVAQVGPDHPLENCARATTTLAEDDPDPVPPGEDDNEGCATARTPLPDPTVTKTGPSTALPGERVTWTLTYRNLSRESAIGTYLIDRLPYVPSDAYPTAAAVRYAAHHASHGEVAWFHAAPRNGPQPAFNPSSPGATGWQSTPTSPVNWVAFVVPSPLPALSSPRQIQIDADLFHPVGQQLPEPGTRFENCVTVAMGGVGAVNDGNPNNNTACATVGTPGIDLALSATCTPGGAELGVRPGDSAEYSLTVRNAGTTIAYGIRVTPSPGARLLEPSLASPVALALDASGQPIALRDEAGDARTSAVEWTAAGADWLLGTAQPGSANHHRTVGLPPGASVTLTFTGTVSLEALSEELIVHAGLVTPEYGLGFIPGVSETEDNTSNNAASCDVTAYRPDLLITKDVELLRDYPAGGLTSGVANVGDTLRYTLVVSNLGRAAASNPRIQDFFPAGTRFVPGSLTGDLGGAIVEYADADFNWSASASANAIGLRLVFPGTLEVGGSGLFELDTAAELGGDGHSLVNASIDPVQGLVVPDSGDMETLGCSSNDTYTLGANRTYTHTASYMSAGWNFWPFNEHVYTYEAPFTGCCLDQPSHAYDVCTAMTQNEQMNWESDVFYCDEGYGYSLDGWLSCLCTNERYELEQECVAACEMQFESCMMDARANCMSDFQEGWSLWSENSPMEDCMSSLSWYDTYTGATHDHYLADLQEACVAEYQAYLGGAPPEGCDSGSSSNCYDNPPFWTDDCGNQQDTDPSPFVMACQSDYNTAWSHWQTLEPTEACFSDNIPTWYSLDGMSYNDYDDACGEWWDCEPNGTGPCAYVGSNFEMQCTSDPMMYASALATEWEGSCGAQPTYPCFGETYAGPPPEDRCNTNAFCTGKTPTTGTASYTSPLGPSDDGSVRVQSWLALTVEHTFAPGDLRVDLVDADGQPIAGFEDLPLDTDGQTSLASLPTTVRELAVKTTFTSAGDGCFEVGPLLDVGNTQQAMNNMGSWLPNVFPPLTFADGRMTRVQFLTGGPDLSPISVQTFDDQLVLSAIGEGGTAFQLQFDNSYDSTEPWFDTASDGAIAGPHTVLRGNTYNIRLVGTGLLVGPDFTELPAEDFDPTWGEALYDQWWMNQGGSGLYNDPGRLVASKDLVVGAILSADQADWEQCNADVEAACMDELAAATAYHEKVQQCALWVDCLYGALSDCELNADPEGDGCGMVTDYTGFCGALDHEEGCVTDEWSDEWSDYDSERWSPYVAPYAQDCEAALRYGERGWSGPGPQYGYVYEGFSGFYGGIGGEGGYDFASCDDQLSTFYRLAVFTRTGEGWSVELLPDAPALGIYGFAASSRLIDVSADGSLILAQYHTQLAVWRRGPNGQYQAERVATVDIGTSADATIGGLSDDGTFVWWSYRWANGRNRVATYNAGTWTAQVLAADGAVQGGDANGRVFFGDVGAQRRRWVPSPTGYTSQTFSTAGLTPALIGGAATLVGIGPDGTVVGHYEYSDNRFPEYGSFPGRAGLVWPPEGPPIGLTLEPGYELMAAHVTADRRVFGYYAPDNVDYNLMLSPMPAYGAFEYRCSATSRPSLDKLTLTYDAADSAELSFDVEVADLCQTEVTNVASVENDVPEITLTNNTDDASSGINAVSLEASVTASKVAVSLNDTIVYTYTVKNTGPGRAQGVAVTGALSPYVTIQGGTVPRTFAELAPNETQTWQVTTRVNTNLPNLPLTATVGASTDTIACDTTRETASATSLTGSWPNIAVTKTGPASATVSSGATPTEITYTLNVASNGNDISRNVVLTDTLPNDVTFVSSNPPASVSGQVLTWTLGDMAAGTNIPVTVTVRLPACAAVGTTLVNTASATTTSLEADTSDNSASTTTSLTGPLGRLRADVSLDRPTLMSGERLWYTVRYWNQGAAPVTGATLTVPLPANATFVPGSAAAGLTPVNGTLTWNLGTVGLGASGSVGFAVIATGGPIAASPVTVDGGGTCPFTATVPAATTTTGGLVISKAANTHSACASEQPTLTWSLTVINRGASPLTGVVVTDAIPAGTSYVGGSITGLGANAAGAPTLSWNLGALAPGRGVTLSYRTTTPTGALTLVSNTASAAATGVAAVTSNTATVLADCAAPLALDKSWSGTCSLQGEAFAVTLRARNRTGLPRTVTLTDALPPTLEVVDRGGAGGTGNDLEFAGVLIPAASTVTRSFTVKVAAGVTDGTPVTNQAHLSGGGLVATSNPVTSVPITCPGAAEPECQTVACSVDGLCVYPSTHEGQTCSDDSLCTVNDRCELGACVGQAAQCDDDETCTADRCDPAIGCVNDAVARNGASCIDGDACTTGDTCQAGDCVPGAPRDCDDGNPCTDDSCDPAIGCVNTPNTASCDDGNACTTNDTCSAGACAGGPPLACNDDQPCTDDSCNPATGCVFVADNTNTCNDGRFCTTQDRCDAGLCVGNLRTCNDNENCTADRCDDMLAACVFDASLLEGTSCDDGSACTTNDVCSAGDCGGTELTCGQGECAGTCDPETGCEYSATNGVSCDDGDVCTQNETCSQGLCGGAEPVTCNDNNDCTLDTCDPVMGCIFDPEAKQGQQCDADSNLCTQNDSCQGGTCTAGAPVDCSGDMGCEGTCDSMTGACDYPTGTCDDGDACTSGESCDLGACANGTALECDDNDPCTDDRCDPMSGCVFELNTGNTCDDEDLCTTGDTCQSGVCVGDAVTCEAMDSDCQLGSMCDPGTGQCTWSTAPCNDDDLCTTGEVCGALGVCGGGAAVTCDDDEVCTDDYCEPTVGCVFDGAAMDGEECDADESACTPVDTCVAGACVPDMAITCEGDGGCSGTCADATGLCVYPAEACDDENACTTSETCAPDGTCGGGAAVICPSGANDCQLGFCDPELGCRMDLLTGLACDDGDDCTEGDLCETGNCQSGPEMECDDNDACTSDACVGGECVFTRTGTGGLDDNCDGIDDDCDGLTDEDYQREITCGVGECAGMTGLEICVGGQPLAQCDAFFGATAELCDGLDNDCDGNIDEGYMDGDCGEETVVYLIVNDSDGVPIGTARCFQAAGGGAIRCDTDPQDPTGKKLRVYDALLCPVE